MSSSQKILVLVPRALSLRRRGLLCPHRPEVRVSGSDRLFIKPSQKDLSPASAVLAHTVPVPTVILAYIGSSKPAWATWDPVPTFSFTKRETIGNPVWSASCSLSAFALEPSKSGDFLHRSSCIVLLSPSPWRFLLVAEVEIYLDSLHIFCN